MRYSRRRALKGLSLGVVSCLSASKAARLLAAGDVQRLMKDPPVLPVPRAGKPGPPMLLGTSVMDTRRNELVKSLGFSYLQTDSNHLIVNEPEPGHWDWTASDAGLAATRQVGVKWEYFPHYQWGTKWYRQTAKFVPCTGLRSRRKLACISLWSPDILRWFEEGYAALAEHYGRGSDKLYAIYVGIYGDFGECIFPMGFHPMEKVYFGPNGVGLPDFWCGDDHAKNDFRRFVRNRYGTIAKLNAAWETRYSSFPSVGYPPAAYRDSVDVTGTPQRRRYWLDFIEWYYGSMTEFCGEVCRIARKHFPNSLLQIPIGGGSESLFYGQDTTAIPKIVRQYGVHVRSTHGGYKPFPQGYPAMIKRTATPCKVYNIPFCLEPPSHITPEGEVGRFMEALSCGNFGFWDWGKNPVGAADMFREYTRFLTREKPVVDVALFFPTTDHRLKRYPAYPAQLQRVGAKLRDVMDYDVVGEELIEDDALKLYRVLLWIEGRFVPANILQAMRAWVEQGGVLVRLGAEPVQTVDGNTSLDSRLLGLATHAALMPGGLIVVKNKTFLAHFAASADLWGAMTISAVDKRAAVLATTANRPAVWAMPHGKGWVIVAADTEEARFEELARDAVYNLSKLDPTKHDALEVDTDYDGVYATLLTDGEAILYNYTSEQRSKTVCGTNVTLPPTSLRSVLVRHAMQST